MSKTARMWSELAGAAMILLSAGCETFVTRPLTDSQDDGVTYRLERKLDDLWLQVGAIRNKVDPDPQTFFTTSSPAR